MSGKQKDPTREKARKGTQASALHFVNVAVTPLKAHIPVRDAQEESHIRAHVMKDYLQQKHKPSKLGNTLPAVTKLSDHLVQFRLPSRGKRKRLRGRIKGASSEEHTSTSGLTPTKMVAILPKDQHNLRVVSPRSFANSILSNFPSHINTSSPGIFALLEYYYYSFWDNSLAVNPEGKWMSTAISDPATFHASLCLFALHKVQTRGGPQTNFYLWHRGEAMRLISQSLADPGQATSDATIGAVAILSASDNSVQGSSITQTSHIEGMITLVELRGGIHEMNTNRHIQRVVAWADILHASAHNSRPHLGITQYTAHCEMKRLKDVVQQHKHSRMARQDVVPAYFRQVLEDLQALAMAYSLIAKNAVSNLQELRPLFSSALFMTEHSILELGTTAAFPDSVEGNVNYVDAAKAAALIFSFENLRDIAITAAFFDSLIGRLRDGLCGVFDLFFDFQNPAYIPDEILSVPFLLWLCLNGWKASAIKTRQTDRTFFAEKAAVLCESAQINTLEELSSHVSLMGFMAEYYIPACGGLWTDINTWTASREVDEHY